MSYEDWLLSLKVGDLIKIPDNYGPGFDVKKISRINDKSIFYKFPYSDDEQRIRKSDGRIIGRSNNYSGNINIARYGEVDKEYVASKKLKEEIRKIQIEKLNSTQLERLKTFMMDLNNENLQNKS